MNYVHQCSSGHEDNNLLENIRIYGLFSEVYGLGEVVVVVAVLPLLENFSNLCNDTS